MSGSDRDGRWPQRERRSGADRRTGSQRRASHAGAPPGAAERRTAERRQRGERRSEEGWQPLRLDAIAELPLGPDKDLLRAAAGARAFAQAQYSNFSVGAALETAEGRIVTGCNIENATYGLTLCAERVALVKALSDGHTTFTRIAVVADTDAPTPPCGPCRQLLWEYCGDIEVILGNTASVTGHYRLHALLPLPFDRRLLGK